MVFSDVLPNRMGSTMSLLGTAEHRVFMMLHGSYSSEYLGPKDWDPPGSFNTTVG